MNVEEHDKNSNPLKIAMVGYLNTVPLVYGLNNSSQSYELHLDTPAKCYKWFTTDDIDVALLPVGVLPLLENAQVVTDFCIGCKSYVRTVCLFSHSPKEEIKTIYLDNESRTSVLLIQVLVKEYWGGEVVFIDKDVRNMDVADLQYGEALLMIGDKVFEIEDKFEYKYDLGKEWFEYSGNPFVFAVWVAKPYVTAQQIVKLNEDLQYGAAHVEESLKSHPVQSKAFDLTEYFGENIDYNLDEGKIRSMNLFLSKIELLQNQPLQF